MPKNSHIQLMASLRLTGTTNFTSTENEIQLGSKEEGEEEERAGRAHTFAKPSDCPRAAKLPCSLSHWGHGTQLTRCCYFAAAPISHRFLLRSYSFFPRPPTTRCATVMLPSATESPTRKATATRRRGDSRPHQHTTTLKIDRCPCPIPTASTRIDNEPLEALRVLSSINSEQHNKHARPKLQPQQNTPRDKRTVARPALVP